MFGQGWISGLDEEDHDAISIMPLIVNESLYIRAKGVPTAIVAPHTTPLGLACPIHLARVPTKLGDP